MNKRNYDIILIQYSFLYKEKFVLSKPGTVCQGDGSDLLNKAECRVSFETIKKTYSDAKDCLSEAGPWPTRPKGCFYHTKNKCIHWNPHATGRKNNDDVQICSNTACKYIRGLQGSPGI